MISVIVSNHTRGHHAPPSNDPSPKAGRPKVGTMDQCSTGSDTALVTRHRDGGGFRKIGVRSRASGHYFSLVPLNVTPVFCRIFPH